jgi:G3E family GTPase
MPADDASRRDGRPSLSASKPQARIPALLITGFLGSGKTTLVNQLLKAPAFARAAVVVSEYGIVGIDHVLVQVPRRRLRIIDGGCLCGHVHEEVATSLLDLHSRRDRDRNLDFDCVLIETSGLADPVPLIQTLLTDRHVSVLYELKTVIAVADGVHGAAQLEHHEQSIKQAAVADTIVISKSDIADAGGLNALAARLGAINPGARQLRARNGEVSPDDILHRAGYDPAACSGDACAWLNDRSYAGYAAPAAADPAITTFTLSYYGEITLPGLVLWMNLLAGFRGAGLLRVKGIVNVEGRPYAVQAVQTIISEPVALDAWPEGDDRCSRLVFITRSIDAEDIRRTFATFSFDAGRAARNLTINPATYARFRDTIELFRTSPRREATASSVNHGLSRKVR